MSPVQKSRTPSVIPGTPAAAKSASQRRTQQRTPYRVPCRVKLVNASTGEVRTVVGETVNLSPRGVALQLKADVRPGTWVETMVPHRSGDPLFLCGKVQHVRRTLAETFEIGIEIDEGRSPFA